MAAGVYNWTIEQGTTVDQVFTWQDANGNPINLTGYSARMQIRSSIPSNTVLWDATTANGKIILGGTAGTITVHITDTETAAFNWPNTGGLPQPQAVYDLELVSSGGQVTRLLQGVLTLSLEVTR